MDKDDFAILIIVITLTHDTIQEWKESEFKLLSKNCIKPYKKDGFIFFHSSQVPFYFWNLVSDQPFEKWKNWFP